MNDIFASYHSLHWTHTATLREEPLGSLWSALFCHRLNVRLRLHHGLREEFAFRQATLRAAVRVIGDSSNGHCGNEIALSLVTGLSVTE